MSFHSIPQRKTTVSLRETLRCKIERIAKSIDRVSEQLYSKDEPNDARLECLAIDAERLAGFCRLIRKAGSMYHSNQTISLDERMARQDRERGFDLMPLESDLLIKRVKDGGYSGQFLADAFISYYRTDQPFPHSLGQVLKLDPEGFRLFHQIIHIRLIPGWSDQELYGIEQEIKSILVGEAR